jgi:hypothetical protein
VRKLKFILKIYIYKLQGFLGLERSDIMPAINNYYRADFHSLNRKDVAVILPHCLIGDKCPAKFSKSDGILCRKCSLCGCSGIRESAEQKGYQFYISPSVGFTKRLIQRKNLKGILGVACDYEIEKGIHSEKITFDGVKIGRIRVKSQGVRLDMYDCIKNNVDWEMIKRLM